MVSKENTIQLQRQKEKFTLSKHPSLLVKDEAAMRTDLTPGALLNFTNITGRSN